MQVILSNTVCTNNYSVEAGLHDGQKHFDHHGNHSNNPSPANNSNIPVAEPDATVDLTHTDADSLLGVARLQGRQMPNIDLSLLEKIDCNGSSIVSDKFDRTLLYMIGIGSLVRSLRIPRCTAERQDITEMVNQILDTPEEAIIQVGRVAQEQAEQAYADCKVAVASGVGLWSIGPNDQLDPSRPYLDGIDIVVVYRSHYKSISIYCAPKSIYTFGGKIVGGIQFAGHPKAAGSPRGMVTTLSQAVQVFADLVADEVARVTSLLYK